MILPLSLPGVFAGVLMTFVPTSTDYVNSGMLGRSGEHDDRPGHPGAVPADNDYPTAAALSFVLMAVMLIGIFAYARALGTEDVMEVAAR